MNILERSHNMKHVSSNKGGEYHGPCPVCTPVARLHISDRFHIWPQQDEGRGSWWCRGCDKGGDALQYLRDIEGMTYRQACQAIGKEYDIKHDTSEPSAQTSKKQFTAAPAKETSSIWRERAERFITWSHEALREDPTTLQWLADQRGISYETVKKLKLGYNHGEKGKDIYRPRKAWGLEESLREDGKAKKLWLPCGLTIPWSVEGIPARIRIRRPDGEPRYYVVPGSSGTPMLLDATPPRAWKVILVVESELDGIMIHSQVGHLVACLPMGSSHTKPDANIIGQLLEQQRGKGQAVQIKVALDNDAAGTKAAQWWVETFGATIHPVPAGCKDPGEAWQRGDDIVAWVESALPAAYHVGQHSTSGSGQTSSTGTPPPLIRNTKDRKGRPYTITDSRVVYHQKQDAGEVVMDLKEMALSKQAIGMAGDLGQEMADCIMEVKQLFKGSFLMEVTECGQ